MPREGHALVAKTDAIVAGVHFRAGDPADLVARKALRVNLSDLAAKGALPRAYLLDLVLPHDTSESWIAQFASGLAEDQRRFGVHLIGGDTNSSTGPATIAVTLLGEMPRDELIRRSGGRNGDLVFVTGTIGDAALGLQSLQDGLPGVRADLEAFLVDRYRLPLPRVELGPRLRGIATAAIDVSDGVLADLGHLCDASGLNAIVDSTRVPLSPGANAAVAANLVSVTRLLAGGDDYEILFTAPPALGAELAGLSRELDIPVTAIGRLEASDAGERPHVTVLDEWGRISRFDRAGWSHF